MGWEGRASIAESWGKAEQRKRGKNKNTVGREPLRCLLDCIVDYSKIRVFKLKRLMQHDTGREVLMIC